LYIAETTQNIRTFWVAVPAAKGGGGGTGIRTLGGLSPSSVFKTGAFDHSATPPTGVFLIAGN
jgi:hypothetical protein